MTGIRLFGVMLLGRTSGGTAPEHPYRRTQAIPVSALRSADTTTIRYRELGAIVRPCPFASVDFTAEELQEYQEVIGTAFHDTSVLPAPFGAVFRSTDLLQRWLEMNYIALAEGMHFVDGRCETRVRAREPQDTVRRGGAAVGGDASPVASECFRLLRKDAVAAVPLRQEEGAPLAMSGAFLIQRTAWDEFAELVSDCGRRYEQLTFEQTGPWPPYDFVRMDFGA
ncbi:MAG: GvpL/GvpF family gas vesicle protein [Gemmatimonadota bacterium]|nr:GvpL/GvpF family gas vesicle protein [Gemmatimonadota bacterium]